MSETYTDVPPGCWPIEFPCANGCGRMIQTYSETDPDQVFNVKEKTEKPGRFGVIHDYKTVESNFIRNLMSRTVCSECVSKIKAERKSSERSSRTVEWEALCPKEFRCTVPSRLPFPSKLDRVLNWRFGPRGLMLTGPTGSGKSRSAWALAKREFFAGRSVAAVDALFSVKYAQKVNVGGSAVLEWIEEKLNSSILLLDDVLKVKLENSGAEAALFAIINDRTEQQRPIILTTQDSPETLMQRMSRDRGEALLRRLKEFCETIVFASGR